MPPYKDKRNGRWRFRGEFNGKPYSGSAAKGNNTRAAAIAMEREMLKRLERRVFTGIMPTVAEFVERFLEYQQAHTAALTYEGQTKHLELHVVPVLGPKRLDAVGAMEIDELKLAWTKKGAAATTINTRLGTFRRMLSLAFEWKIIVEVPKFRWMPTDIEEDEVRFLSDADAAALVAAAKPEWQSMVLVALRTGLRIGELRGLQWTDIDFERRVIRVARNEPGRPDVEASSTKGGRGRTVPLTEDAYQCLVAMPHDSKWVWHSIDNRSKKPVLNRPRSQSGCRHGIEAAALVAKLEITGWHMLRHTYASHLVMRGVSLKVVQELLGHASIKQTEIYAHLAPGFAHHAAVAALDYPLVPSTSTPPALPPGEDET